MDSVDRFLLRIFMLLTALTIPLMLAVIAVLFMELI